MRKFRCFMNYDKEEKWLNDMAKKGYGLKNADCFGYEFYSTKPENATIRIDYRNFNSKKTFVDYCMLFQDSGWQHIVGSKFSGTQYFKKTDENGEDDIFSDVISKAGKYKRLSNMYITMAVCYLCLVISLSSNGSVNTKALLNPKLMYYTPGLWQATGIHFWVSFIFETPFAILRGYMWVIMIIITILMIYYSIKSKKLYDKQRKLK